MSDSRILSLSNGLPDRQKARLAAQNVTVGEVNDALERQAAEYDAMVKHYLAQVPDLVARMIVDFMRVQGMEIKAAP